MIVRSVSMVAANASSVKSLTDISVADAGVLVKRRCGLPHGAPKHRIKHSPGMDKTRPCLNLTLNSIRAVPRDI